MSQKVTKIIRIGAVSITRGSVLGAESESVDRWQGVICTYRGLKRPYINLTFPDNGKDKKCITYLTTCLSLILLKTLTFILFNCFSLLKTLFSKDICIRIITCYPLYSILTNSLLTSMPICGPT